MPFPLSSLPEHLGESFSVRAARGAGVSVRRLRGTGITSPFRGVRLRDAEHDDSAVTLHKNPRAVEAGRLAVEIRRHARAFATTMHQDWFITHVAAAVLWDLPLPLRLLRTVLHETQRGDEAVSARGLDVRVMAPLRATRAAGTSGHQLLPSMVEVRSVDGLRVSSPASTWALLAGILSVHELIVVGDAIVNIPRRRGMIRGTDADALDTLAQLDAVANSPYRRHAAKLLHALSQVRVGSSSPGETDVRRACALGGLPDPVLDYDVYAPNGVAIGYTEIAYPDYRVLVEYEGDHHRTDARQWQRDVDKHAACADAGYAVVRLTSANVYPSTATAVARIRAALL
ncbi:hypothetical protein ACX9R5_07545 [Rathayibacter sp. CAU 1779]